jgi:hypothetical protein
MSRETAQTVTRILHSANLLIHSWYLHKRWVGKGTTWYYICGYIDNVSVPVAWDTELSSVQQWNMEWQTQGLSRVDCWPPNQSTQVDFRYVKRTGRVRDIMYTALWGSLLSLYWLLDYLSTLFQFRIVISNKLEDDNECGYETWGFDGGKYSCYGFLDYDIA